MIRATVAELVNDLDDVDDERPRTGDDVLDPEAAAAVELSCPGSYPPSSRDP